MGRPCADLYPTAGTPQQDVEAWRVAVAAAFAGLDQPEGFAEHLVCCDGLRHQEHPLRGKGERATRVSTSATSAGWSTTNLK